MKRGLKAGLGGFSMVEVTLALGLVTFCLVALVGLLPVGLDSVKAANDEAAAINCMEQIACSIREAVPTVKPGDYEVAGAYKTLSWSLGGDKVSANYDNLSASGFPASKDHDKKYKARVEITPPPDVRSVGTAKITVVWPTQAYWDDSASEWVNAQGTVHTWLVFLSKQ